MVSLGAFNYLLYDNTNDHFEQEYLNSEFNQDHVGKSGFFVRLLSYISHIKIIEIFQAWGKEML